MLFSNSTSDDLSITFRDIILLTQTVLQVCLLINKSSLLYTPNSSFHAKNIKYLFRRLTQTGGWNLLKVYRIM